MRETLAQKKTRTGRILAALIKTYPDAVCSLTHGNPFELLVSTILSAQCTDVRVNMVTPALFARFPTPAAMAGASVAELEKLVATTGFFRSKAKALKESSADIVAKHGGHVPQTMEELTALRGVGRKTANVVLGNAYGRNVGVVVDTHVGRISNRLGLTSKSDPVKIEQDLVKLVPQDEWTHWSHLLIYHGRAVCAARNPKCSECPLLKDCPTGQKTAATK